MIAEVIFAVPLYRSFSYNVPPGLAGRVAPGLRVRAPFGRIFPTGLVVDVKDESEVEPAVLPRLKYIEDLVDRGQIFEKDIVSTIMWMSGFYKCPPGLVYSAFYNFTGKTKIPAASAAASEIRLLGKDDFPRLGPMTPGQEKAFAEISGILSSRGSGKKILLWGPPGSGKTRIFAELIKNETASGGQALYLLPDINLADAAFERLKEFFPGEEISLWHSRIPARRKKTEWENIRNGNARIIVGSRSAVFLPFRNLALAVVDEEQDEMYKQEDTEPHFHAREVITRRVDSFGGALVCGSSCPSMETYRAALAGASRAVRLVSDDVPPARVEIIDAGKYPGEIITPPLLKKIEARLARDEKVLLINNRRGHSFSAICSNCGRMKLCLKCRAPMGVRMSGEKNFFYCPRCSRKEELEETCSRCGKNIFKYRGSGTEKVEREVNRLFPERKVFRIDGFSRGGNFAGGVSGSDVIIGTRLAGRGHNYPRLGLVALLNPEFDIHASDFRSGERMFQALVAASGRLSREITDAELIIQTRERDYYIFHHFANMNYEKFAAEELEIRKKFSYPPFSLIAKVSFSGKDAERVNDCAAKAGEILAGKKKASAGFEFTEIIYKPRKAGPRALSYILKGDGAAVRGALDDIIAAKFPSRVKARIFVDPHNLMVKIAQKI